MTARDSRQGGDIRHPWPPFRELVEGENESVVIAVKVNDTGHEQKSYLYFIV